MNKTESFDIEPHEETWAKRRQGRGLVAPSRKPTCKGGRCNLYRWYPPLLVVSTIMTAVFCYLYLTKPVFLEAPSMKVNDGGDKVPPGYMIVGTGPERTPPAPEPGLRRELDPGRLSFPSEPREVDPVVAALSQPEPLDVLDVPALAPALEPVPREEPVMKPFFVERPEPMPVRVNVGRSSESSAPVGAGGFQPLHVAQADKPLFQSLTKADLARLEARRRARKAQVVEETAESVSPPAEDAGKPEEALVIEGIREEPGGLETDIAVSEDPAEEPGEKPVMRASFIGEFYQDKEEDVAEEEILHKTVMR